ncbi:hypothetical protein TNCV_3052271 [Trichonephila clavipes]|nr:hypothetical protein TNCV_3052271 [Trichonephila clavipes]
MRSTLSVILTVFGGPLFSLDAFIHFCSEGIHLHISDWEHDLMKEYRSDDERRHLALQSSTDSYRNTPKLQKSALLPRPKDI